LLAGFECNERRVGDFFARRSAFDGRLAIYHRTGSGDRVGRVTVFRLFAKLRKNEDGATAIEYGLIAGLICIVIITTITLVGSNLESVFNFIASTLDGALQS
jgi:pilus assembly protein Flp/PilA